MSSPRSKNLRMGNYSQKSSLSSSHSRETKHNCFAEKESRSNHINTECMLQSKFLNLTSENLCFKPEIDLLATNINTQFGKYSAFRLVLGAMYIECSYTHTKYKILLKVVSTYPINEWVSLLVSKKQEDGHLLH